MVEAEHQRADVLQLKTRLSRQEEFVCEPPMITRHTSKMFVMEGQEVSLRCRSVGDPEPSTHWVSPDGKLIGNTSRTVCYENGSLDILKASVKVGTTPAALLSPDWSTRAAVGG